MKEVVKKEIIKHLDQTINILKIKELKDLEELKVLSNKAVEGVALYKDLDLISVTVLIYSLYKITNCLGEKERSEIISDLERAENSLKGGNLGKYNSEIKHLFKLTQKCNAKTKDHLENVMHAARIKKGTSLLERGLSIGQAAGLMGLSNWELQQYIGKTSVQEVRHEKIPARTRMIRAIKIFG